MDEAKEEGGEDVRECSNCRHSIAAANLVLHEAHCARRLALCERCGDAVPRGQLQEHVESEHSEVTCPCGVVLEKCQLKDHQGDTCDLRLCECRYCELALPQRELPEHEHFCGARTEPCPACGAFVQHRDKKAHAFSCPRAHARLQQGQQGQQGQQEQQSRLQEQQEQQKHQQCLQKTLEQQELQKQQEQQNRLQKQLEQQQKHEQWLQEQQKQ
uniref:XIAP-associated factor 1-like n=1 Tax=Petromyzon marinus TaxID=7757 RepID=A0AAJ7UGS6_PETMA